MNFHAKALLAFIAFQVIVTGGGLLFDHVPQAIGQGANDNDTQLVGAVLRALWCLTLSMGALGMAYLSRAAWKMGLMPSKTKHSGVVRYLRDGKL